jgi:hypothetical protein
MNPEKLYVARLGKLNSGRQATLSLRSRGSNGVRGNHEVQSCKAAGARSCENELKV